MADAGRKPSLGAWAWVFIVALVAFELLAHALIERAIPSDESWERASAFVRAELQTSDIVVAAPPWIDPIVRHELGDLISLRRAAPADLGGVDRIWELATRGATTRSETPALERDFDGVVVRMWPIDTPEVLYDFVEQVAAASVDLVTDGDAHPCPWTRAAPDRGGLERGPMRPSERFVCDPRRPWLWVGPTVLADLELRPRRCIWQHPAGIEPVRTTFSEVPMGQSLVLHAGVDYQVARHRAHSPVTLSVWIDGELAGELLHRDGDGWSTLEIDTSARAGQHATVRFETTAVDPTARLFCYAASTQTGSDDE